MTAVRTGIVGCGVIGKQHANAAAADDGIDLVALADLDRDLVQKVAEAHDVPTVHEKAEDLIDDDQVEAVVLALPTGVRLNLALRALAAGKHVLLEKPGAMNMAEVEQLEKARGDRVIAVASSRFQFLPCFETVRDLATGGALGGIRAIRIRGNTACGGKANLVPWRLKHSANGGGLLVNWGTYDLDYALACVGWSLTPRTLLASTWPIAEPLKELVHPDADAETHVMAQIQCAEGCVICLDRGENTPVVENEFQIIGETGAIRQPFVPGAGMKVEHDRIGPDQERQTETVWEGDANWGPLHAGPVRDMARAIREGREPATDLKRWATIQRIFDAAYRSAGSGNCETVE